MGTAVILFLVAILLMYIGSRRNSTPSRKPIVVSISKKPSSPIFTNETKELKEAKFKTDAKAFREKLQAGFISASENLTPKYIFIDFETTDLPHNYVMPPPEKLHHYPYIIQAGILVFNANQELVAQYSAIFCPPDNAKFAGEAIRIHGIDQGRCRSEGVDINQMFTFLKAYLSKDTVLIAHNMKFDNFLLRLEAKRHGVRLPRAKKFCTMKETTDMCAIYKDWGYIYKYPTLKELAYYTYTNNQKGNLQISFHDAMTDIKLCAMCFFDLKLYESLMAES